MSYPERELDPDRSARHRFGYELRTRRKARGLSQDRLGAAVHVSGDLVGRIEIGERRPARDFAERCDRALDAGGELVRLWEAAEHERHEQRRRTDAGSVVADTAIVGNDLVFIPAASETVFLQLMGMTGESVRVTIDRRSFMAGAASVPVLGWLDAGRSRVPQTEVSLPDGYVSDVLETMIGFRAALAAQDNLLGPAVVAPTALRQVKILQQLSCRAACPVRDKVMSIQSRYAELIGWLADDLGDRHAGRFWIDRGLEWAHEAGDEPLVGFILTRKAQRAVDKGEAESAIGLARAAQRRGALTARVHAAAAQYEAQGYAVKGDKSEFRKSIDRAREMVLSASPPTEHEWAAICCTPAYVSMHEAAGWMRLGRPKQAITIYEQALAGWSDEFRRDKGVYYSRLAGAYAAARDPELAARAGRTALMIARDTDSARILAELKLLPASLIEWKHLPEVREFAENLDQVVGTVDGSGRLMHDDYSLLSCHNKRTESRA